MKNEIIKASEFGLEQKQVGDVDKAFAVKASERELLAEIYAQIIKKDVNKEVAVQARDLRLNAVKVKSGIAAIHKTQKGFALAFGKYCDAWKRKETEPIQQIIDGAMEIEKFEEIREKKRLEALQEERVKKLSFYLEDAAERELSKMEDDVWEAYFNSKKKACEDLIEAERETEKQRVIKEITEKREREQIKNENERLKKEAEERKKIEAEESKAREKIEAERKAKEEAERKKYDEELKREKDEKIKLENELKSKQDAENKKAKEREDAEQFELSKNDAIKALDLISDLESLKSKYFFKSEKNKKMYSDVKILIGRIVSHINK